MDARQEAFSHLDQVGFFPVPRFNFHSLFFPIPRFNFQSLFPQYPVSIFRAFDDCAVTESIFKLLHIFGNLVQRNLIALELSDKMPLLIVTLDKEMDDARKIFMKQQVLKLFHEESFPGFVYHILFSV